ncbi:MAG: CPBP family intramembrane glutamic endopeptidase [Flavobacterium sp.]|uniref:CPBP family intramembrane glutamic endopeptidase n=1 Tax=Flavobacterium sp. TaxID=239 RepID=UPI00326319E1
MSNPSLKQKFFSSPFTRVILGLLVCFAAFIIAQNAAAKLLELTTLDKDFRNLFKGIIASIAVIAAYKFFYRWIEKREVTEISTKGIARSLLAGLLLGVVLQSLTILVIYLSGGFKLVAVNPLSFVIIPLTVAFSVAIFEEILLRGIIFRIVEEKLGSVIALVISAIVFGALHLANPNSTVLSATCVTIEAGLLLGTAYIYTRNLWFPIAFHFAWNFLQSGIFGAITSGNEKTSSLLTTEITGSKLITGGGFGPEATIQATLFCLIATLILLYLNKVQHKFIKPYWKR